MAGQIDQRHHGVSSLGAELHALPPSFASGPRSSDRARLGAVRIVPISSTGVDRIEIALESAASDTDSGNSMIGTISKKPTVVVGYRKTDYSGQD
jgi:hypothetical protein